MQRMGFRLADGRQASVGVVRGKSGHKALWDTAELDGGKPLEAGSVDWAARDFVARALRHYD